MCASLGSDSTVRFVLVDTSFAVSTVVDSFMHLVSPYGKCNVFAHIPDVCLTGDFIVCTFMSVARGAIFGTPRIAVRSANEW